MFEQLEFGSEVSTKWVKLHMIRIGLCSYGNVHQILNMFIYITISQVITSKHVHFV